MVYTSDRAKSVTP